MPRAATSFTMRVSGVVAMASGENRQFMKAFDGRFVATNNDSTLGFMSVYNRASHRAHLLDLIAEALRTGSIVFTQPVQPSGVLNSVSAHISGQVAYDDESVGGFDVELTPENEVIDHYNANAVNTGLGDASKVVSLRSTIRVILSALFNTNVLVVPAT